MRRRTVESWVFIFLWISIAASAAELPFARSRLGRCLVALEVVSTAFGKFPRGFQPFLVTERTWIGTWEGAAPYADENNEVYKNHFTVISKSDFSRLGRVALFADTGRMATGPIHIEDDVRGMGLATEVKLAVLSFGFDVWGVTEFLARIHQSNQPSQLLHSKLGFRLLHAGEVEDWILSANDFKKVQAEFKALQERGEHPFLPRRKKVPSAVECRSWDEVEDWIGLTQYRLRGEEGSVDAFLLKALSEETEPLRRAFLRQDAEVFRTLLKAYAEEGSGHAQQLLERLETSGAMCGPVTPRE